MGSDPGYLLKYFLLYKKPQKFDEISQFSFDDVENWERFHTIFVGILAKGAFINYVDKKGRYVVLEMSTLCRFPLVNNRTFFTNINNAGYLGGQ